MSGKGRAGAGVATGVVGAGLMIAAGVTFFGGDREVPPVSEIETADDTVAEAPEAAAEPGGDPMFCHPAVLAAGGCAPLSVLKAGPEGLLREGALPAQPVEMVGLDSEDPDATADDCASYADLRRAGYGAATSAGMAREAQLSRTCGLLAMAGRAEPVPGSLGPEAGLMARIPGGDMPKLGETGFPDTLRPTVERESPLLWSLETEAMRGEFLYIGTANFDGDPEAEHLIEWRLAATGGTLRAIGYGLAEDEPASFRAIDPFAP